MPFGLKGAPATFQHLMNSVLSGINGIKCFVYIDDIVVYGNNLEDHNHKLKQIFDRLRTHNLKLNPNKCRFLRKEIIYLGHIISESGIKPDPRKIDSILNYPPPTNAKEIKSFIGLVGYYRKFIENFSKIAQPLTSLLKKNVNFHWSLNCNEAFELLKKRITSPPVLQFPDFNKQFILTCDASDIAIGAVLSQNHNTSDLPIAFASRVLNKAEKNYPTVEKELLAIVWAVNHFRPYLYGTKFQVVTDHKPLLWLCSISNPTSRLMRWRIKLDEYNYDIVHKSGISNQNADALSRIILPNSETTECKAITRSQSRKTQLKPNELLKNMSQFNKEFQLNDNQPNHLKPTESICQQPSLYVPSTSISDPSIKDTSNNLSTNIPSAIDFPDQLESQNAVESNQIIELKNENDILKAIEEFHVTPVGGHQGIMRTYKRLKSYFYFPKMVSRITKYIKSCEHCQKNKHGPMTRLPMKITSSSRIPFERIFLDIVGPLISTYQNNKYILTIQDDLTKYSIACPIPNQEAETIAKAFVKDFICVFGCPLTLLTDQGSNFVGDLFTETCKLLKIKKFQTTAYHPQSNGAVERSHRTLSEYLRNFCGSDPLSWDSWLQYAMFSYNSTPHSSTSYMPYELVFGNKPVIPHSFQAEPDIVNNYDDYVTDLRYRMQQSFQFARENILNSKFRSKERYDKNSQSIEFNPGEYVLLKNDARPNKLSPLWLGPYKVNKIISKQNTSIIIGRKFKTVHNNRLKAFNQKEN